MADKEGWDLNAVVEAVVRGCPARTTAAENENPLSCLSSLTFEDDDSQDPFGLGLHTQAPSDELQEVYKPFYNANTSAPPPNPGSAAFNNVQFSSNPAMVDVPTTPQFNPGSSSTAVAVPAIEARRQAHPPLPQPQMAVYPQVSAQAVPPLLPPPPMQAPNTRRARKRDRKNQQQQKSVCHLSADNLSSDPWAWRKYGQKPIKGSPYPRNYYRCSSSKGCSARKQVEKSTTDPEMFVVTYTGEHNHTRPTHRNSLAGSTRNKFAASSSLEKPDGLVGSSPAATGCSSSAKNQRQLSPRTPLTAPIEEDAANFHGSDKDLLNDVEAATMGSEKTGSEDNVATGDSTNDDDEVEGEDDEEEDEDEDDLLIPNMAMSEEIFMGFRELGHCPGSADSWGPARADLPRSSSSSSGAGRS